LKYNLEKASLSKVNYAGVIGPDAIKSGKSVFSAGGQEDAPEELG